MKNMFSLRNATLALSLTAVGVTAWAANELITEPEHDPLLEAVVLQEEQEVVQLSGPIDTPENPVVLPGEEVVVAPQLPPAQSAPPAPAVAEAQPPITIEERRLATDERIQLDVIDRLASATDISGKIGVETKDQVVTLTGHTTFQIQADRAARYARGVEGVKYVQNEIRPRMGRL